MIWVDKELLLLQNINGMENMNKYKELLFLKGIKGVGPVRINKFYVPLLQSGLDFDGLVKTVKDNEKKTDEAKMT